MQTTFVLETHRCSGRESELSEGEVISLLLGSSGKLALLEFGELTARSTGSLSSQVNRQVSFLFEGVAGSGNAFLTQDGHDLSDGFSHMLHNKCIVIIKQIKTDAPCLSAMFFRHLTDNSDTTTYSYLAQLGLGLGRDFADAELSEFSAMFVEFFN